MPTAFPFAEPSADVDLYEPAAFNRLGAFCPDSAVFPNLAVLGTTIAIASSIRNFSWGRFPEYRWASCTARQIWPHPGTGVNRVGG